MAIKKMISRQSDKRRKRVRTEPREATETPHSQDKPTRDG